MPNKNMSYGVSSKLNDDPFAELLDGDNNSKPMGFTSSSTQFGNSNPTFGFQ